MTQWRRDVRRRCQLGVCSKGCHRHALRSDWSVSEKTVLASAERYTVADMEVLKSPSKPVSIHSHPVSTRVLSRCHYSFVLSAFLTVRSSGFSQGPTSVFLKTYCINGLIAVVSPIIRRSQDNRLEAGFPRLWHVVPRRQ